jgi:geranylgeranyl diphosphate synthase type I
MIPNVELYTWKECKTHVDEVLRTFLASRIDAYTPLTTDPLLRDAIYHATRIAQQGSKRVRTYSVYLSFVSHADSHELPQYFWHVCASIELFHTFLLIQDDVIDRGTMRHGLVCLQSYIYNQLVQEKRTGDLMHIAQSYTYLIADLMHTWVYDCLRVSAPMDLLPLLLAQLSSATDTVVIGQLLDVDHTTKRKVHTWEIETKHELKTAQYSFVFPMQIGQLLAGAPQSLIPESIGIPLGMAYQLQDDVLDSMSDMATTGKTLCSDVYEGKHTYLTQFVREFGSNEEKHILAKYFGKQRGEVSEYEIRMVFQESGALAFTRSKIDSYIEKAMQVVLALPLMPTVQALWIDFFEVILTRKK